MTTKIHLFKNLMFFAFVSISSINAASATIITSNFSFGSGTPFGGTITLGDIDVTLTTTNTQPFGSTSFRDLLNTAPSLVTFEFSAPVSEFSLTVSRILPPDEFLTDFNIGDPTTLTGDLINIGGDVTSSQPGDFGTGSLIWSRINTSIITFTIGNDPLSTAHPALAIDEFGISGSTISTVPTPATFLLFSAGLLGILVMIKKSSETAELRA